MNEFEYLWLRNVVNDLGKTCLQLENKIDIILKRLDKLEKEEQRLLEEDDGR